LLWGRSANRCAICKQELVIDSTPHDDESIIGEECHIISARNNGPRYQPDYPKEKVDSYENLILLCSVHHKMIDDQYETYTREILYHIKNTHEKWVFEKFENTEKEFKPPKIKRVKENIPEYLRRLTTSQSLLEIMDGADACYLSHDELKDEYETEQVGTFLQMVQDWGDFSSDFDVSHRVRAAFELSQTFRELDAIGFFIFGAKEIQIMEGGFEQPINFIVAHIRVIHQTSEEILTGEKFFKDVIKTSKERL